MTFRKVLAPYGVITGDGRSADVATNNPRARHITKKEQMKKDTVTLDVPAAPEEEVEAPDYVLDEIDAELEEDDDLDLTAEPALTTDSLQQFLNEAGRYPLLTAAEEVELAKRIERGDMAAKDRMITSNLRLVVSIARRYQTQGITLGDLIQEGVISPDPRHREVRLAQRAQVLDLRDLVDPPGGAARRRQQVADDPHSSPRRRA